MTLYSAKAKELSPISPMSRLNTLNSGTYSYLQVGFLYVAMRKPVNIPICDDPGGDDIELLLSLFRSVMHCYIIFITIIINLFIKEKKGLLL